MATGWLRRVPGASGRGRLRKPRVVTWARIESKGMATKRHKERKKDGRAESERMVEGVAGASLLRHGGVGVTGVEGKIFGDCFGAGGAVLLRAET